MVSPLGDNADHLSIDLHLKFFCVQTEDRCPFSHGIADIPVPRRIVFHKKGERLPRLPALSDHGHTPASDDGLVVCGEAARVFFIGDHHLITVDAEADVRLFLQDIVSMGDNRRNCSYCYFGGVAGVLGISPEVELSVQKISAREK